MPIEKLNVFQVSVQASMMDFAGAMKVVGDKLNEIIDVLNEITEDPIEECASYEDDWRWKQCQ